MSEATFDKWFADNINTNPFTKITRECYIVVEEMKKNGILFDKSILLEVVFFAYNAGASAEGETLYNKCAVMADEKFYESKCGNASIEDFHKLFAHLAKFVHIY